MPWTEINNCLKEQDLITQRMLTSALNQYLFTAVKLTSIQSNAAFYGTCYSGDT